MKDSGDQAFYFCYNGEVDVAICPQTVFIVICPQPLFIIICIQFVLKHYSSSFVLKLYSLSFILKQYSSSIVLESGKLQHRVHRHSRGPEIASSNSFLDP